MSENSPLGPIREQLLDISKRNRLLNTPVASTRARQLYIEDERSDEVFKILYRSRGKMTFDPRRAASGDDEAAGREDGRFFVPDHDDGSAALASHHVDRKLQTRLSPEQLQKRLLTLYRYARSLEEEQGVSILYLGIGFLEWFDDKQKKSYAPLILLPVDLERHSARGRFRLGYRDQDLEPNLSLQAMLRNDFELDLPELPDLEESLPSEYFDRVRTMVSSRPKWRLLPNVMVLGFYSFAKFLMWRDLAPDNEWMPGKEPVDHPLVRKLLVKGSRSVRACSLPTRTSTSAFPTRGRSGISSTPIRLRRRSSPRCVRAETWLPKVRRAPASRRRSPTSSRTRSGRARGFFSWRRSAPLWTLSMLDSRSAGWVGSASSSTRGKQAASTSTLSSRVRWSWTGLSQSARRATSVCGTCGTS